MSNENPAYLQTRSGTLAGPAVTEPKEGLTAQPSEGLTAQPSEGSAVAKEVRDALAQYFGGNAGSPFPGQLGIREKRTWHSWQLAVAAGITLLAGLWIGYVTYPGSGSSQNASKSYALPPPSGSSAATATTAPATAASSETTTTVAQGASTVTTVAASSGTVAVLLGPTQSSGNWTSSAFTIGGGQWNIGWAYQCTPAPSAGTSLQVFVDPSGGTPSTTAAVSETGGSGNGVTPQSATGSQVLRVVAPANCIWAVKVTGIG